MASSLDHASNDRTRYKEKPINNSDQRFERLTILEAEDNTGGQGRKAIARRELEAYRLGKRWLYVRREDWRRWLDSRKIPADPTPDQSSTGFGGGV